MFFDAPIIRYFTDDSSATEPSDDEEEFSVKMVEKKGRKRRIATRSTKPTLKVPKMEEDNGELRRSPRKPGVLKEVANISVTPPKKRHSGQIEPIDPPNPYSANIVNDRFQRLMRDYIDLYFYMYMPDHGGFCSRPLYQPFMNRNLYYMKTHSLSVKQEPHRSNTRIPRPTSSNDRPKPKKSKFCWEESSGASKLSEASSNANPALTVKFSYIRHSDMPGHQTAKIQLFIATETDEDNLIIEKQPCACFDMPMNEKLAVPISIDLPPTVNLETSDGFEIKCHYLVTRVLFSSGEGAMTSSGKSLRNVPSRQAALCEKARSLRHSPIKKSRVEDNEIFMYGAKQLTEITKDNKEVLDGDGGIVLIEAEKLHISNEDDWKSRDDFLQEVLRLGKKFHSNPFINLSFVEDSQSNESSCSESDSDQSSSPKTKNGVRKANSRRLLNKVNFAFEFPRIAYQFAMESDDFPTEEEKLHRIKSLLLENNQKPEKSDWVGMFQGIWAKFRDFFQEGTMKKTNGEGRFKENHRQWENQDDELALPPMPKTYMIRTVSTPQKCYFCPAYCFNLMALMKHLKLCHPRFNFVYRPNLQVGENQTLPGITVTLDPYYDGSNEINPMAHYVKTRIRGPQQRPPNNIVTFLVIKNKAKLSRKTDKNIKVILSKTSESNLRMCDQELRMIYFDERHRHPTIPFKRVVFENDGNMKSINHLWLMQLNRIKIDEIKDLLPFEKEFMLLWNRFLLESRSTAPAYSQLYRLCRHFLVKYSEIMVARNLLVPWTSHISFLAQKGLLDWSQVYDLLMRSELQYDPLQDPQHPISRYKHKLGQKGRGMEVFEEMIRTHKNNGSNAQNGHAIPSYINEIKQRLEMAETGSSSSSSTSTSTRSSLDRDFSAMVQPNVAQPKADNPAKRIRRRNGEPDYSMFL